MNIETALKKEAGVKSANVNFASEKLHLEYDPMIIDQKKIIALIKTLGYNAIEAPDQSMGHHDHQRLAKEGEIKKLKNRFILSLIFGVPVLVFSMMGTGNLYGFIQGALATAVIISCFNIWRTGFKSILRLSPDMYSLIFLGTAVAYFYSLISSILMLFNIPIETHLYYESAALILVFISLGEYLQAITKGRAGDAIKKLIGLQSKEALIIKDGKEIKTAIENVKAGDIIIVKPGEKIPVDGIVIDGYSGVDEKAITGESMPVEKKKGDGLIGATINKSGVLKFKATKIGQDTMLAQIIHTVEEAMGSKAPIQLLADKFSFYFVPAVIGIAILSLFTWLLLGQSLAFSLTISVAVLIVACPCALGLATPTAVMMGTGLAAKNGILIKNGQALEKARNINTVVFDKTGTLTKGNPVVTKIINITDDLLDVLQIAASVEKNSEHPLAQAIVNKATEEKKEILTVNNFSAIPGYGVSARLNNHDQLLGTKKLMADNHIDISVLEEKITDLENNGQTIMLLAQDKKIIGLLAVADTLKEHAKQAVAELQSIGKKVAILTGDNERVGKAMAEQVGADTVLAEVLPSEKAHEIKKLQQQGNVVAMVGDGINDAPALAQADLGIALGSGTDIAMETGEIILIKDDLRDVLKAINLSNYTLRKIKQNLFWAFFYNIISIPIAAGVLYSSTGWLLNPSIAAAAMAFSSVSVVLNSLSMKRYKGR
jgi:Cu+-exporting ATPase